MELKEKRKIFHSEADFQFALAWEIQRLYPDAKVRLEYCPAKIESSKHIDILVIVADNYYPIELKYKTRKCTKISEGEMFKLKNHGAQDIGRYDVLYDVQRIELLSKELQNFKKGYVIFLTNDPAYWSNRTKDTSMCQAFKLTENEIKTSELRWAEHTGQGTMKGRELPIILKGKYKINWKEYSELADTKSGNFRYIILETKCDKDL